MTLTAPVPIEVCPLPHFAGLDLPSYETPGSAGMDLRAALPHGETVTLAPGARVLIPTGLSFAIPIGFEVQIRPRSGLAIKHGVTCLNTPGTIDSDYRGEVKIILINHGDASFRIDRGERVAQMVLVPVTLAEWKQVVSLQRTTRGTGGFGSTGR